MGGQFYNGGGNDAGIYVPASTHVLVLYNNAADILIDSHGYGLNIYGAGVNFNTNVNMNGYSLANVIDIGSSGNMDIHVASSNILKLANGARSITIDNSNIALNVPSGGAFYLNANTYANGWLSMYGNPIYTGGGGIYLNAGFVTEIGEIYFYHGGNITSVYDSGINYLTISAPSGTGKLRLVGNNGNLIFDDNVGLAGNGSNQVGIYNQYGSVALASDQNVYISGGGSHFGGTDVINLTSFTNTRHNGSYAGGLISQITNTGTASPPGSRFGTVFIEAPTAASTGESGTQISFETGGYGGAIFGGIKQGAYGFLSLATNNGVGSQTERLRIVGNTGYVGIGQSNPAYLLDVNGTGRFADNVFMTSTTGGKPVLTLSNNVNTAGSNGPRIALISGGATGNIVGIDFKPYSVTVGGTINVIDDGTAGGHMSFLTQVGGVAVSERMRINASGNVGIGTTTPAYLLDVLAGSLGTSAGNSLTTLRVGNGNGNVNYLQVTQVRETNGSDWYTAATRIQQVTDVSVQAYLQFNGASNTYGANFATPSIAEALVVKNSGYIGIGTWSPNYKLDVIGSSRATLGIVYGASDVARLILGPTPGTGNYDYCSLIQSESSVAGNFGSKLSFWTHPLTVTYGDPVLRMIIDQVGNVGIGTTTPVTTLDVNGGLTVRNGIRPIYVKISSGTSITPASSSYGTHYDITTSSITGLTIAYPASGSTSWSNDSNGYWIFRNNSGTYLSITITYTNGYTPGPSNITIPPGSSTTLMATYPGGGTNSNYVLF